VRLVDMGMDVLCWRWCWFFVGCPSAVRKGSACGVFFFYLPLASVQTLALNLVQALALNCRGVRFKVQALNSRCVRFSL
jgi:hypothetical protein